MLEKRRAWLVIAGLIMGFALLGCKEKNVLPIGTKVEIVRDVRKGGPATGEIAEYIGSKNEGWLLFGENGKVERESWNLPDGYQEWNPKKQKWPHKKTGIKGENPLFRLEDGSEITGLECYWQPVDKNLRKSGEKKALKEYHQILDKIKRAKEKN